MLTGTMGTVEMFGRSQISNRLSDKLMQVLPDLKSAIIVLALFSGFVSAFLDNVATVLILAPVGLAIAKKLKISPVGMILAIAVSSNLQGAAALAGDTTSILLGGHPGMLLSTVLYLILVSFLPEKPEVTNGLICIAFFIAGLIPKGDKGQEKGFTGEILKAIDYETLVLRWRGSSW